MSCYGGPIPTPNIDKIAADGVRYTQWHTTALCSPTRSCLLTGRNHTRNSMACITEAAIGFPNASGTIPPENGMLPEILGELGWNTYMVGKWHLCPTDEMNLAALVLDPLIYLTESIGTIGTALPDRPGRRGQQRIDSSFGRQMGLAYAAMYAARSASGEASHYARARLLPLADLDRHSQFPIAMLKTLMVDWSATPAIKVWLRKTARQHPEVLDLPGVPADVEAKLDFWTRVYAAGASRHTEDNFAKGFPNRLAIDSTLGYLVRLGFAARLYRSDHGAWPERLEQLVPAYVPADTRECILGPVHMGVLSVDDSLREALWDQYLPKAALQRPRYADWKPNLQKGPVREWEMTDKRGHGPNVNMREPMELAYLLRESLRHYPDLVDSTRVEVRTYTGGVWERLVTNEPTRAQVKATEGLRFHAELRAPNQCTRSGRTGRTATTTAGMSFTTSPTGSRATATSCSSS